MAGKDTKDEKSFRIADTPLEVKLAIQRAHPPVLHISVGGPKRNEHKDPHYVNAIKQLFDDIKDYIQASGCFPPHGRFAIDTYAGDFLLLNVRFPGDPPPHHAVSLVDMLIREPLAKSQRAGKNKKDSEKLFGLLSEKMPGFIDKLKPVLENDRFATGHSKQNAHGRHSKEIKIDNERKEAYELLGVTASTPWEKMKSMYREKARSAHPDAKGGVDDGSFHKLQTAYELLKKWHEKTGN